MSIPVLTIRIAKHADGTATLTCVRADGSMTWQRQRGVSGAFFPLHDLTHYAVETTLGYRKAFYGLVAQGWNLEDFGAPWPRGRLPVDMDPAELLVGFLDTERAARAGGSPPWTAGEFTEQAATYYAAHGIAAPPPVLTDEQLARIRQLRAELFERWNAVPPGSALALEFDPGC